MSLQTLFTRTPFAPRAPVLAGRRLYAGAAAAARDPAFYEALGAPDTVEGRFEVYGLHVVLLLRRLRGEGAQATETSQALFDALLRGLDDGLREMGVGDLSVGKKMRKMGAALYGRMKSYEDAFAALPDAEPLRALTARTVLRSEDAHAGEALAGYTRRADAALAAQPLDALLAGDAAWPPVLG